MPLFWTSGNVSSGRRLYFAEFWKKCKEIENYLASVVCSLDSPLMCVDTCGYACKLCFQVI